MEMAEKEDHLDLLKTDVWTKFPQVKLEGLEQICKALNLPIDPSKTGKRSAVYSIVTLHLMSDEVDGMEIDNSLQMFENVQTEQLPTETVTSSSFLRGKAIRRYSM